MRAVILLAVCAASRVAFSSAVASSDTGEIEPFDDARLPAPTPVPTSIGSASVAGEPVARPTPAPTPAPAPAPPAPVPAPTPAPHANANAVPALAGSASVAGEPVARPTPAPTLEGELDSYAHNFVIGKDASTHIAFTNSERVDAATLGFLPLLLLTVDGAWSPGGDVALAGLLSLTTLGEVRPDEAYAVVMPPKDAREVEALMRKWANMTLEEGLSEAFAHPKKAPFQWRTQPCDEEAIKRIPSHCLFVKGVPDRDSCAFVDDDSCIWCFDMLVRENKRCFALQLIDKKTQIGIRYCEELDGGRAHPDWKACMVRLKDENEDWRATVFEKVAYSPVRLFNYKAMTGPKEATEPAATEPVAKDASGAWWLSVTFVLLVVLCYVGFRPRRAPVDAAAIEVRRSSSGDVHTFPNLTQAAKFMGLVRDTVASRLDGSSSHLALPDGWQVRYAGGEWSLPGVDAAAIEVRRSSSGDVHTFPNLAQAAKFMGLKGDTVASRLDGSRSHLALPDGWQVRYAGGEWSLPGVDAAIEAPVQVESSEDEDELLNEYEPVPKRQRRDPTPRSTQQDSGCE